MTKDAGFKQRVRARMERTGETYATARSHLDRKRTLLHVTNGDSTVEALRTSGFTEPILPWRDILHDGPVPAGLTGAELRKVRARFIAGQDFGDYDTIVADFTARDDRLARNVGGQYALWFESDLYDQLQVAEILDRLARLSVEPEDVTIVTASAMPGEFHHGGTELRSKFPAQQGISADTFDLAHRAWTAFTSSEPEGLAEIARTSSFELQFLGDAFGRLMREYPATSDGLALTERRLLLAIESGAPTAGDAFAELQRREPRPYLGDWPCYERMSTLATCRTPLLKLGSTEVEASHDTFRQRSVALTEAGRDVLAGRADQVQLNGIDRWIGGVHLEGPTAAWRYDDRREALLAT